MDAQADNPEYLTWVADVLRPADAVPVSMERRLDWAAQAAAGGAEAAAFWDLLERITAAGLWPGSSVSRLLDLACGPCREAAWLAAWCRRQAAADPLYGLVFHGVDVRAPELDVAAARLREGIRFFNHGQLPQNTRLEFRFRCASGASLDGLGLEDTYPLVFIRHQNAWNGEVIWGRIFESALARLAPGGRLIWTSYFDREHELAKRLIGAAGGRLVGEWRNPRSAPLPTKGKSMDRWVAAAERSEGASVESLLT